MPLWLQHTLAIALAAACVAVLVIGALRTLRGRTSGVGNCCAKGCESTPPAGRAAEKVLFIPADALRRRK